MASNDPMTDAQPSALLTDEQIAVIRERDDRERDYLMDPHAARKGGINFGLGANAAAEDRAALLAHVEAQQQQIERLKAEAKPPRGMQGGAVFHNTKFAGTGFGGVGDYRVIVRRDRKTFVTYLHVLDDSDGVGLGFTKHQAPIIIEAMQRALEAMRSESVSPLLPAHTRENR